MMHPSPALTLNARTAEPTASPHLNIARVAGSPVAPRLVSCPVYQRTTRLPSPRAFWLAQARFWIGQARMWRTLFGGDDHAVVLRWYLHALLEADRYRAWARELAPALRAIAIGGAR